VRVILLALSFAALLGAGEPEYDRAKMLFNSTDFEQSLSVLQAIPEKNAAVYELMGRNLYLMGHFKRASEALEKAAQADPKSSEIALWTGRALGRRAETSSMMLAPTFAWRARQYFERAVQLDPRNLEALSDLFDYYLEAPGFLGGGMDKAEAIAARIARIDAGEGHWTQAKLAEKRKEYANAEAQLRRAAQLSPRRVGRYIDLAKFLARQGRYEEAEQCLAQAEQIAPSSPSVIYARADLYIKHKRNLEVAKTLLIRYMSMNLTPNDPPRSEAAKLLRQAQGG
jgi:tetratricopeptide (TPR) repeat protein